MDMPTAIASVCSRVATILSDCVPTIYLHGSCVLGDFRAGWSDIDIIVLTERQISKKHARILVDLRQLMLAAEPDNPFYRRFEGAMLTMEAFLSHAPDAVIYWGTSGERVTDRYELDACSMWVLRNYGRRLHGYDLRERFPEPSRAEMRAVVQKHYETIRQHAVQTDRSLYSCGWLLDIARGVYTLRTGEVISKTAAGEWALREGIFDDPTALIRTLEIRRDPLAHVTRTETFDFAETLGETVQRYADVLERELQRRD